MDRNISWQEAVTFMLLTLVEIGVTVGFTLLAGKAATTAGIHMTLLTLVCVGIPLMFVPDKFKYFLGGTMLVCLGISCGAIIISELRNNGLDPLGFIFSMLILPLVAFIGGNGLFFHLFQEKLKYKET